MKKKSDDWYYKPEDHNKKRHHSLNIAVSQETSKRLAEGTPDSYAILTWTDEKTFMKLIQLCRKYNYDATRTGVNYLIEDLLFLIKNNELDLSDLSSLD
ncbi:hypothetical protein [Sodalis sp. RH19]|uniref:hypothetical protein n=1 Tax=Sodalis sp. RH19 TaxID=3394334 RepID=UPI0039B657A0